MDFLKKPKEERVQIAQAKKEENFREMALKEMAKARAVSSPPPTSVEDAERHTTECETPEPPTSA